MEITLLDIFSVSVFGLLSGFVGSQVGGGGLISLPVLLFIGLSSPTAVATNRFAALFLNLSAAIQYFKKKKLDLKHMLFLTPVVIGGSVLGANLILNIDELLLKKVIAFSLVFLLVFTLYKKKLGLKDRQLELKWGHFFMLSVMVAIIGIYGGLIGIAATSFLSFLFVFYGQSFTQAMGYALFLSVFLSLAASAVYVWSDMIIYSLAIPQAIAVSIGAWFGARFAIEKGNKWVKYLFVILVLVFVAKLLMEVY